MDPAQKTWNEKYRERGLQFTGSDPSDWLCAHEDLLVKQAKGKALDVACGNGRNAFYLARLGFDVEAIDFSDVAIEWLEQEMERRTLLVTPRWADVKTCEFSRGSCQVVVNFNFLERAIFPKLVEALAPGGLLLFETMTQAHIDVLDKKFNRKYVLKNGELRHAFPELETLFYREEIVARKGGGAAVAGIVARKP